MVHLCLMVNRLYKINTKHRVGVCYFTYFVALDLGLAVSPYILGVLRPMLGFEGLYMLTGVMSVICLVMYFVMYGSRKQNYADKEENNRRITCKC